jgi:hypothetical protein
MDIFCVNPTSKLILLVFCCVYWQDESNTIVGLERRKAKNEGGKLYLGIKSFTFRYHVLVSRNNLFKISVRLSGIMSFNEN